MRMAAEAARKFPPPTVERGEPVGDAKPPWWHSSAAELPVRIDRVDYVGGHDEHSRLERDVSVELEREQVRVQIGARSFTVPWLQVTLLGVDGPAELARRDVVRRMARKGGLELGKVKVETVSYLVVETGAEALIFASTTPVDELAARCAGPLAALGGSAPQHPAVDAPVPAAAPTAPSRCRWRVTCRRRRSCASSRRCTRTAS